MITDFPEAKKEIKKAVDIMLRERIKEKTPLLSMANKKTLQEGDKLGTLHVDGRHTVRDFKYIESSFSIPQKEIQTMKTDDFLSKVSGVADDMASQMELGLIKTIDESAKETGNNIPGNPELGPDSMLLALEMIFVQFEDDDRTKPIRPSIVAAPGAVDKLMELEAKSTPEEREGYLKREEAIFDKKYEEYIQDLNSRKIVD